MLLETIKARLHEHKFRLTHEREAVLTAFMKSDRLFSPAELHRCVKDQYTAVGLTTVYRLLEVLTKLELATPFLMNNEILYAFCPEQHHHHFVCLACRRVKDLYDCTATPATHADIGTVKYHRIDLFGCCKGCEGTLLPS